MILLIQWKSIILGSIIAIILTLVLTRIVSPLIAGIIGFLIVGIIVGYLINGDSENVAINVAIMGFIGGFIFILIGTIMDIYGYRNQAFVLDNATNALLFIIFVSGGLPIAIIVGVVYGVISAVGGVIGGYIKSKTWIITYFCRLLLNNFVLIL